MGCLEESARKQIAAAASVGPPLREFLHAIGFQELRGTPNLRWFPRFNRLAQSRPQRQKLICGVSLRLRKFAYSLAQPPCNLGRLQNVQIRLNHPDIITGAAWRNYDDIPAPILPFSATHINLTVNQ